MRRATVRSRGVVLMLVGGLVSLLLLLCLALTASARAWGSAGRNAAGSSAASLAATSGMEYAAARLLRDPGTCLPPAWSVSSRGDDWTFRDGPRAAGRKPLNPSYSHGEAWIDAGPAGAGTAGVYEPGIDGLSGGTDLDGNGRLSAWSGRLRGPAGARFSLRIECEDGKIPVNGGSLWIADGIDNDGDGEVDEDEEQLQSLNGMDDDSDGEIDEPDEGVADLDGWRGIEDHRDLNIPSNSRVRALLDGLCEAPAPEPTLGERLIQLRPVGGYRSWADLRERMVGHGVTVERVDAVRPFVDLGPYGRLDGVFTGHVSLTVPVNLWFAPREVLVAFWEAGHFLDEMGNDLFSKAEMEALAAAMIRYRRQSGMFSWEGLPDFLADGAASVFAPGGAAALSRKIRSAADGVRAGTGQWSADPPLRFSVESRAGDDLQAAAEGLLRTGCEILPFRGQEDFEQLLSIEGRQALRTTYLADKAGIRVVDDPPPEVRRDCSGSGTAPRVVSLPKLNLRGFGRTVDPVLPTDPPNVLKPPYGGFARGSGGISLGPVQRELGGAGLYWPFAEDFDAKPSRERESEPTPYLFSLYVAASSPVSAVGEGTLWDVAAFQCPGFNPLPAADDPVPAPTQSQRNPALKSFSLEGWFGRKAQLIVTRNGVAGTGDPHDQVSILTVPGFEGGDPAVPGSGNPDAPGIFYVLKVRWSRVVAWTWSGKGWWVPKSATCSIGLKRLFWFRKDDPVRGPCPWSHIALAMQRDPSTSGKISPSTGIQDPYLSTFTLYVDGAALSPSLVYGVPGSAKPEESGGLDIQTSYEVMRARNVDELRFYKDCLALPFAGDRFFRQGEYVSPLYALGASGTLPRAWWHGAVPGWCRDASGALVSPFGVQVEAYQDEQGASPAWTSPWLESTDGAFGLGGLGMPTGIRSFRYRVRLDCGGVAGPLFDAPVLEAIAFQVRRGPPGWARFGIRG